MGCGASTAYSESNPSLDDFKDVTHALVPPAQPAADDCGVEGLSVIPPEIPIVEAEKPPKVAQSLGFSTSQVMLSKQQAPKASHAAKAQVL